MIYLQTTTIYNQWTHQVYRSKTNSWAKKKIRQKKERDRIRILFKKIIRLDEYNQTKGLQWFHYSINANYSLIVIKLASVKMAFLGIKNGGEGHVWRWASLEALKWWLRRKKFTREFSLLLWFTIKLNE